MKRFFLRVVLIVERVSASLFLLLIFGEQLYMSWTDVEKICRYAYLNLSHSKYRKMAKLKEEQ